MNDRFAIKYREVAWPEGTKSYWCVIDTHTGLVRGRRYKTEAEAKDLLRELRKIERRQASYVPKPGRQARGWSRQDGFGN